MVQELKTYHGRMTCEVVITEDSQYNNLDADWVIVNKNVTAVLYGRIKELLIVHEGAKVYLHANMKGDILLKGGEVIFKNK